MSTARIRFIAVLLLVLFFSYFNIYSGYDYPPYLFWDENFHIASAQKYLHGVFFMEPHPPLGKLFIALGEYLFQSNSASDQFLGTSFVNNGTLPKDFSFSGYRFFPVLFAALTPLVLFLLGRLLTGSDILGGFLAALLLFDNAFAVHLRGAMLEGPQLFFMVLALYLFFLEERAGERGRRRILAVLFGAALGAALSVKATAAVLCALYFFSAVRRRENLRVFYDSAALSLLAAAAVFLVIWEIHFSIVTRVVPELPDGGYFSASDEYREILDGKRPRRLSDLPRLLADSYIFTSKYERGVPLLDLCKPDETGSPFYLWPFGGRSINYRWERDDGRTKFLYLQANPAAWGIGLLGLSLSGILLGAHVFFPQAVRLRRRRELGMFFLLYVFYLGTVAFIPRVLYLYHYFIPLLFTFVLFVLSFDEIERIGTCVLGRREKNAVLGAFLLLLIGGFLLYAPLTYYRPVSNTWLENRSLLPIWDLRCAGCPPVNGIAFPTKKEKARAKNFDVLTLNGIKPISGQQQYGDPQRTAEGFLVHAKSILVYPLGGNFRSFVTAVRAAERDPAKGGSMVFEVYGDSELLFKSETVTGGGKAVPVSLDITGRHTLRLVVLDAGDGIENDHALWIDPRLERK